MSVSLDLNTTLAESVDEMIPGGRESISDMESNAMAQHEGSPPAQHACTTLTLDINKVCSHMLLGNKILNHGSIIQFYLELHTIFAKIWLCILYSYTTMTKR